MNFKERLRIRKEFIDNELSKYFDRKGLFQQTLIESMKYSISAGGKRLRPILVLETCDMLGGNIQEALPFACAIEMIHTYSLIHDDLPAMDNDDYRRGKLTNHKVFGEGIAVLAGDGLLNYAFEIMAERIVSLKDIKYARAMYEISKASGVDGMIGGQVVDLESEGKSISKEVLEFIHLKKTSAMIEASVKVGAIIGGATEEQYKSLEKYSRNIGLVFQIVDDILDVIGDESKLGKRVGSDIHNQKSTYPLYYGIEESRRIVKNLIDEGIEELNIFDKKADFLRELALYLRVREY